MKVSAFNDLIHSDICLFAQSSALIRMMQSFLGDETLRKGIGVGFGEGSLRNETFFPPNFLIKWKTTSFFPSFDKDLLTKTSIC